MKQESVKDRVIEFLTGNERFKRRYPDTPVDIAWHCVGIKSEFLAEFNEWMERREGGGTTVSTLPAVASPAFDESRQEDNVLHFPMHFGQDTRAFSNPMAKCALFAAVKERQFFKDYAVVGTVNGMLIEVAGESFNQDDHDVFMQLAYLAFGTAFGENVVASVSKVLSGLGRHAHKEQRMQLFEQVSRLVRTTVRITPEGMPRYEGHLLDDAITPADQKTLPRFRRYLAYRLNPKFSDMYSKNAHTLVDFKLRLKIKGRGSELAKWVHLWVIGNAEQFPHKVETIRQLCGSQAALKEFRRILRQALDLLKNAGIIASWRIDPETDLVHIDRTPSPAQLAHLNKKGRAKRTTHPPKD
jgi:hypothetical protein